MRVLSSGALLSTLPPAFDLAGGNFPVTHSAGTSCGHQGWGQGDPARQLGVLGSLREGGPVIPGGRLQTIFGKLVFLVCSLGMGPLSLVGCKVVPTQACIRALVSEHTSCLSASAPA